MAENLGIGTGIHVYLPAGDDLVTSPLSLALTKAGLNPMSSRMTEFYPFLPDVPVIIVGERFPRFLSFPFEPPNLTGTNWKILPLTKQ